MFSKRTKQEKDRTAKSVCKNCEADCVSPAVLASEEDLVLSLELVSNVVGVQDGLLGGPLQTLGSHHLSAKPSQTCF